MFGGNTLPVKGIQALNLVIVAIDAESRTTAKAIHDDGLPSLV
jgi:hypothetical protein